MLLGQYGVTGHATFQERRLLLRHERAAHCETLKNAFQNGHYEGEKRAGWPGILHKRCLGKWKMPLSIIWEV